MSTLKCTTLSKQDGSASVPVDTVVNGSAKAWVNLNGTGTASIRAAFNVSSITDGGVGVYTVNFATPMPDINYSVIGTAGPGNWGSVLHYAGAWATAATVNGVQIMESVNSGTARGDSDCVGVAVFR